MSLGARRAALFALALLLVAACAAPSENAIPARTATACGSYSELAAALAGEFGERPVARGRIDEATLFELWAGSASWSAVVVDADGRACLTMAGDVLLTARPAPR